MGHDGPMLSLSVLVSTFTVIFIAELPDKTALAALLLGSRYRVRDVIIGTGLAFLVQTIVAVIAGRLIHYLPAGPVEIASGIGFLVFAVLALRRDAPSQAEEEKEVAAQGSARPVWLMSFLVIFAAEWGDLTQLATAALVARGGDVLSVGLGAVLALWTVTVLAVTAGKQVAKFFRPRTLNLLGGILFGLIGLYIIATAVLGMLRH